MNWTIFNSLYEKKLSPKEFFDQVKTEIGKKLIEPEKLQPHEQKREAMKLLKIDPEHFAIIRSIQHIGPEKWAIKHLEGKETTVDKKTSLSKLDTTPMTFRKFCTEAYNHYRYSRNRNDFKTAKESTLCDKILSQATALTQDDKPSRENLLELIRHAFSLYWLQDKEQNYINEESK